MPPPKSCSSATSSTASRADDPAHLYAFRKAKAFWIWNKTTLTQLVCGSPKEEKKAVLHRTWKRSLAKCIVHFPAAFAIAALLYFNFTGYFIGVDLAGSIAVQAQSFDRLGLQVTAKLLELFAVASLGVILMDAIRHKLLFGKDGVPLGLLLSKAQFTDVSFLFSKDFRAGCLLTDFKVGPRIYCKRVLLALLIVTCSLVALFIGPSSAVLMIPTYFTAWPAGGARFWLNGDLSPQTFDVDLVRDAQCIRQGNSSALPNATDWTYSSCPWAGYTGLSQFWRQRRAGLVQDVSYSLGTFVQDIRMAWTEEVQAFGLTGSTGYDPTTLFGFRTAAVGTNIAIASFARQIAGIDWCSAINLPAGSRARYQYRQLNATIASIQSKVPVVRTQCTLWSGGGAYFPNNQYPPNISLIPGEQYLPFPLMLDNAPGDGWRNLFYYVSVPLMNGSTVMTQWVTIPSAPVGVYGVDNADVTFQGNTDQYPTAFLVVRNPGLGWGLSGDIACSVQADWVLGYNQAGDICWTDETIQQGVLSQKDENTLQNWLNADSWNGLETGESIEANYNKTPGWQQINMTKDWLNLLTPRLPGAALGYTTLANVLEQVLTHEFPNYDFAFALSNEATNAAELVTAIVSSFVADGASRLGWNENYAWNISAITVSNDMESSFPSQTSWNYNAPTWTKAWNNLVRGDAKLTPDPAYKESDGGMYRLQVTVAGYGLKASGLTPFLALAVLFTQLFLITMHIIYVICTRNDSSSWSSLTDIFILGQASTPPPALLDNTCAGVESHETLKLRMRIRERSNCSMMGREMLQLEVDSDEGLKIIPKREYGVR